MLTTAFERIIYMKINIFIHDKKELFSRQKIFIFM